MKPVHLTRTGCLCLSLLLAGNATASDPLETWLQSTPNQTLMDCPRAEYADPGSAAAQGNPFFGFNGSIAHAAFACRADGPYEWKSERDWFVQRIQRLIPNLSANPDACPNGPPCTLNLIRVCSTRVAHNRDEHRRNYRTPCGDAGPKGCAVCRVEQAAP